MVGNPDGLRPSLPYVAAAVAVLCALIALVVLPLVMTDRTNRLRDQIEQHAEPARDHLNRINYQLSVQITALNRATTTSEERYLTEYREAGAARDAAMSLLAGDVHSLGREAIDRFRELHRQIGRWQRRVEHYLATPQRNGPAADRLAAYEGSYTSVIEALMELDEAISAFQAARRQESRQLMRIQVYISAILVLLALTAAFTVLWLVARLRSLAFRLGLESEERMSALDRERQSRASAESLVRARDEILGIVSHDLRSPLTTIALSTHLLRSSSPEEQANYVETILATTSRMERLIQDLLDASRIESSPLSINPQPVDPAAIAEEAFASHMPMAAEKKIDLQRAIAAPLPEIAADRDRLVQALGNLLGNALKFTPAGGTVRLSAEAHDGKVRFTVSDSGPGIAPHHIPHLFDPFWQAKKTAHLGAGLGLKITRGIIEAHGGSIEVSNLAEGGARFAIELPIER